MREQLRAAVIVLDALLGKQNDSRVVRQRLKEARQSRINGTINIFDRLAAQVRRGRVEHGVPGIAQVPELMTRNVRLAETGHEDVARALLEHPEADVRAGPGRFLETIEDRRVLARQQRQRFLKALRVRSEPAQNGL